MKKAFLVALIWLSALTGFADARPRGTAPTTLPVGNANLNIGESQIANFVNVFKAAGITLQSTSDLLVLDTDGYPASRPTAAIFNFSPSDGRFWPSTTYKIVWNGTRTTPLLFVGSSMTGCSNGGTPVTITGCSGSGNTTFAPTGTGGSVTLTMGATNFGAVYFPKTGGTYGGSGEIAMYRVSDETRYQQGKYFTQEYIDLIRNAASNPIRFMPWVQTGVSNFNNETKWAYRKSPTSFAFRADAYPPGAIVGGGSAAISGTDTYTASAAPDTPVSYTHGEVAIGIVANANTVAGATLDVGARGAKTIFRQTGDPLATSGTGTGRLVAGVTTFVYDSLLDGWLQSPGGITWSMPIEAQAQLANEVNADGWFVYPTMVTDDYVSNWGAAIRTSLNSHLNAYTEYSNETWNPSWPQYGYSYNKGYKLGWVLQNNQNTYGWYALRTKQATDLLVTAFSSQPTRLRPAMGYQIAAGITGAAIRFGGSALVPNQQTNSTVTFTTGTPCQVLWQFNGFTTSGWPVSFTSTGSLPTGITASQIYYVTNNSNNNSPSTTFNLETTPGGGAIACSGTPTGTATGNYTNPYYVAAIGQDYSVKPNRPIDLSYSLGGAPYLAGENLCRGDDFLCTLAARNVPFLQCIVNAVEGGSTAGCVSSDPVALVDYDVGMGRTEVQGVTASGTTFTTPLAHGFTAGSSDVLFQATGGTGYSGIVLNGLYRVNTTPTSTTFTVQAYAAGNPSGGSVNAGSAGTGTMTVGASRRKTLANIASTYFPSTQALAAIWNGDRPVGKPNLFNTQYEGNLEPKGPSTSECTSLGITGTDCAGSIALAITNWKNSASAKAMQIAYYKQFMGTDSSNAATFGLMTNSKFPAQLTLMCSTDYAMVSGCLPSATPYQTYYGFRDFSLQNFLLKRDLNPASNDNDPMWLEKAA